MMVGESGLQVKQIASEYLEAFEKLLHQLDLDAVERIIHRLQVARDSVAMIYVAGNGGSAAAADGPSGREPTATPMRKTSCLSFTGK